MGVGRAFHGGARAGEYSTAPALLTERAGGRTLMNMTRILGALVLVAALCAAGTGHVLADGAAVEISVRAAVEGETLNLRGRATVPDGAWITYAAYHAEKPQTRVTGYARVADGRFSARADVSGWPPGEIAVDAHFQILLPGREQPEAVVELFGEKGERMTGADVVEGGAGYRSAVASARVTKR